MAYRVPITVRLETFEGPLDLLLYLIQSHELDISKVSVSKITDQYLSYVKLMRDLNFDTAGEFLVMAATLLHWKSRSLLSEDGENQAAVASASGEDELSQEELVRQLIERQRFLRAGESLSQLPRLNEDVFARPHEKQPVERVWKEMDITALALGYVNLIALARKRKQVLMKETVSLTGKIAQFASQLTIGRLAEIRTFIEDLSSRPETVVTFLASLELSRLRKMRLYQEEVYGPLYLELLESISDLSARDLNSAFETPISIQPMEASA